MTINYDENENGDNSGWRLIGNPFTCNAYIYDQDDNAMEVMFYDENGDMQTLVGGPVAPMQGFFVKVTETTVLRFYSNPLENRGNAKNLSSHAICLDKKMDKTASQAVSIDKRAYKNVAVVEKKADKNFIILDKKILNKKIVKKLANNDTYSRFKEVKQALPFKK
jgi:CRISPR/Cas system CMR subunit Cmr4 (Cas7 group RAMP superfamily)